MDRAAISSFEVEWPALAGRLQAMLARKGLPPWKRDDIVQETGLRLFRMWDDVDSTRPPWALVVTITLNILRDEARRRTDREVLGAVPEIPSGYDVEQAGIARLELRRVHKAMGMLSPDYRSILMSELGETSGWTQRGRDATKMLRMRARRKLTSLLDTASASGAVLVFKARRLLGIDNMVWFRGTSFTSDQGAKSLAAGMVAVLGLFSFPVDSLETFGAQRGRSDRVGIADTLSGAVGSTLSISSLAALSTARVGSSSSRASRSGAASHTRSTHHRSRKNSSNGGQALNGNDPLRVPIPVGGGYVELGAHADLEGAGIDLGDHQGNSPVCLRGVSTPQLECTEEAPESTAGATAGAKAGPVTVGTSKEIH